MTFTVEEIRAVKKHLQEAFRARFDQLGIGTGITRAEGGKENGFQLALLSFDKEIPSGLIQEITDEASRFTQENFGKEFSAADVEYKHVGRVVALSLGQSR